MDLLSIYGLAREVAALFRLELAPPPGRDPETGGGEWVEIAIDDLSGCPRYVGRTFADVSVAQSPPWLRARISGAGMRPIVGAQAWADIGPRAYAHGPPSPPGCGRRADADDGVVPAAWAA